MAYESFSPDFSVLGNLPQTYRQGQVANARRSLGDLAPNDYAGQAQRLLAAGDIEGGMTLARLADLHAQRMYEREKDARDYALRVKTAERADVPSGFQRNVDGGLRPIAGGPADPVYKRQVGERQNAPPGYRWLDPTNPDAGMAAIPGGPGEKIDAEVAGRLGLAKSFLGQLPDIRKRVEAGELTGPIDAAFAKMGAAVPQILGGGDPGELRRQIDSGAESLLRMLTGAGMNREEATNYVRRYQFNPTDTSKTAVSKLNQLERELNTVIDTVARGRGGTDALMGRQGAPRPVATPTNGTPVAAAPAQAGSPARPASKADYDALPSGATYVAPDGSVRTKK